MTIHNLGYPRIGLKRQLKFALEKYWRGSIDEVQLQQVASDIRQNNWQVQADAGIDLLPVGDFAFYDHVLNTSLLLGVVPNRFVDADSTPLDLAFRIARGRAPSGKDVAASDMTKWFNTNYHYIVPELAEDQQFRVSHDDLFQQVREAKRLGHKVKPVLLGPLSYLYLASCKGDKLSLLPQLLAAYQHVIDQLAVQEVEWLQLDEPILALELDENWLKALVDCYQTLHGGVVKLLVASYFGDVSHQISTIQQFRIDGIHVDVVAEQSDLNVIDQAIDDNWVLSVGCISGRNIWRADLVAVYERLAPLFAKRGDNLWLAPSCSLLHCPQDLAGEDGINLQVKSWLAFAKQKCEELKLLKQALAAGTAVELVEHSEIVRARLTAKIVKRDEVRQQVADLASGDDKRDQVFTLRKVAQQSKLNLPLLPTTTIGSFPQTGDIRRVRRQWRKGEIDNQAYEQQMKHEINDVINAQLELGLDVLVHGEPERNDMVEYFGELLEGVAISANGWVQSYGSRCVKPPIIFGDIVRSEDMTVAWSQYAQSLTDKPVKGMLTGPVTMLCWSFVRDDLTREQVALQLALALQQEVSALNQAGIDIIQIDEPAIREGLPLKRSQWQHYLDWATYSFRLSCAKAPATTQIHTHMCYSEFNDILPSIIALDADVITIETSRSNMALLDGFEQYRYPNDIGPGVYDIHSPNVPDVDWIESLLQKAAETVPYERLWVNPDCGLKTRKWHETKLALANMVEAAVSLREKVESDASCGVS